MARMPTHRTPIIHRLIPSPRRTPTLIRWLLPALLLIGTVACGGGSSSGGGGGGGPSVPCEADWGTAEWNDADWC